MVSLLDVARWLELTSVLSMAGNLGLSRPISVRDLIKKVVRQAPRIEHVFVLMLENRSFDHMLGFARLEGTDAITGQPTNAIDLSSPGSLFAVARALDLQSVLNMASRIGLKSPISVRELLQSIRSNLRNDTRLFARTPADFKIPDADKDPGHEFNDVLEQLCGLGALYNPVSKYPLVNNSGFAAKYAKAMNCFEHVPRDPEKSGQLPVLVALAREFAVCDRWFSSMPGPTWPNRFFIHAASSGGLDDSPSPLTQAKAMLIDGYDFKNGTIFDRLDARDIAWRIFQGDEFPVSRAIGGLDDDRFFDFVQFAAAVNDPNYNAGYTFIEPNYGNDLPLTPMDFTCGNSQHPLDDVTRGEVLIKTVYETIRNSPNWFKSVFLITYDEHGGFFDHVPPPSTVAPGDGVSDDDNNHYFFDFTQLGVRVPAVVISPRIPRGTIDHTTYDHTSLLATIEKLFGLQPLTNRDRHANSFNHLFSLSLPRKDAPAVLPHAADSGFHCPDDIDVRRTASALSASSNQRLPDDRALKPLLRGFLHIAFLRNYRLASATERQALIEEFINIKTEREAHGYMQRVRLKLAKSSPRS